MLDAANTFIDNLCGLFFAPKHRDKCSLIIPALNEEKNIARVLKVAKLSKFVDEIIVVDDGSTDKTSFVAGSLGVMVIRSEKNRGKGASMSLGIKKASFPVVCFIDADIPNWNVSKINKLIKPVALHEAEFVKSGFSRKKGRVTLLTAKPLLKILYPDIDFQQPLSGQFCTRKDFLEKVHIPSRYGVDVAMLIDAFEYGLDVKEVFIGDLTNKSKKLKDLTPMAEQVASTIARKSGFLPQKYPLIVLFIDPLLAQRFSLLCSRNGCSLEEYFKGIKSGPQIKNLAQTVDALRKRKFRVVLLSGINSFVPEVFSSHYGLSACYKVGLVDKETNLKVKTLSELFEFMLKSEGFSRKKVLAVVADNKAKFISKKVRKVVALRAAPKSVKDFSDDVIDSWAELLFSAE